MIQRGAVVAVLVVFVALGVVPGSTSTHEPGNCGADLETIKVGTGSAGIDIVLLNGVNHVDIPFPPCSEGSYRLDHSKGGLAERHCADKIVRVFAPAGAVGEQVLVQWFTGPAC